jgi:micrococcal nuclease
MLKAVLMIAGGLVVPLTFQSFVSGAPLTPPPKAPIVMIDCSSPRVKDGDTMQCGSYAVRLIGVDTPELPGHCAAGRSCAVGDPFAAKARLTELAAEGITVEQITIDRYGRTVGRVLIQRTGENVSCILIREGHGIPKPNWDTRRGARRDCPTLFP